MSPEEIYLRRKEDDSLMYAAPEYEPHLRAEIEAARAARAAAPLSPPLQPKAAPPPPKRAVIVKPLPDPLDERTKATLARHDHAAPEAPTDHGCADFDGAPWDICYAGEYKKDPAGYMRQAEKSRLLERVCAAFRSAAVGPTAQRYSNDVLEGVLAELERPKAQRRWTDEQVCDRAFQPSPLSPGAEILRALRALHGV